MNMNKDISMDKGRIIYLNGVTSSGKTSIVEALQARRDVFFYVVANDLFQETFLKIITKMQDGRYTDSGKFLWWATRVAHNVIIDHYRAVKGSRIIEPGKDNDLSNLNVSSLLGSNRENELNNEQVLQDVKRLMNALPETQREVVFMRFFQELSFKEIAEKTNVSINTSLGRMRYALMNLRKLTREHRVDLAIEL